MRDVPIKNPGDQYFAAELNEGVTEELENIVQGAGITLSSIDLNQLGKAVANYCGDADFYVDSGSPGNYILNVGTSKQPPTQYNIGMRIRFVTGNINTGPSLINVASIGSVALTDTFGGALVGGEVAPGAEVEGIYDGTGFRIVSTSLSSLAAAMTKKFIRCPLTNNTGDPAKDLDFDPGFWRADNANIVLNNRATLDKQIDATWSAGGGAGGRPTAVPLTANTEYHCFYIATATGLVDAGFDDNINATNLLTDATGYIYYARRGSIFTDGSSNIKLFTNIGDEFILANPINDLNFNNPATTRTLFSISVPTSVSVIAHVSYGLHSAVLLGTEPMVVASPFVSDFVIGNSLTKHNIGINQVVARDGGVVDRIITNTSGQLWYKAQIADAAASAWCATWGWEEIYDQ